MPRLVYVEKCAVGGFFYGSGGGVLRRDPLAALFRQLIRLIRWSSLRRPEEKEASFFLLFLEKR